MRLARKSKIHMTNEQKKKFSSHRNDDYDRNLIKDEINQNFKL